MNKRIRELIAQATDRDFDRVSFDKEKFAELIIRECANIAWQHTPETEDLEYSHLIKGKILANFGVTE